MERNDNVLKSIYTRNLSPSPVNLALSGEEDKPHHRHHCFLIAFVDFPMIVGLSVNSRKCSPLNDRLQNNSICHPKFLNSSQDHTHCLFASHCHKNNCNSD